MFKWSGLADNSIFGPVSEWLKKDGWPYENQTQILSKKTAIWKQDQPNFEWSLYFEPNNNLITGLVIKWLEPFENRKLNGSGIGVFGFQILPV